MDSVSGTVTFHQPTRKPATEILSDTIVHLDAFSRHTHHTRYHCPIYCWLAAGKVKFHKVFIESRVFLYMEYRDRRGASCYRQRQFKHLEDALLFLEQEAAHIELPDICGEETAKRPIKLPDQSQAA
ncbi:MAG: hypothetical protein B0D91_08190 [Oceanospirillales bacterium LUC14_002_19_P2]|nr:MAG: hypothetical protein B0D91_08190 [Oceanospirillales bacterium LUC14_002_19_P2]